MNTKIAIGLALFATTAFAVNGVTLYQKNCRDCHGAAYKGSAMRSALEWEKLFTSDFAGLKELHAKNPKAMTVINSSGFKRESKQVLELLKTNASDSGAVRSCDGINCG